MYAEDSFFTLTLIERFGVLGISLGLSAFAAFCVWRLAEEQPLWLRILVGFSLFIAFMWFSPQAYYFYYMLIFPTLPWQVVVGFPPLPVEIFETLTFSGAANLSLHGQGVLGWALIALAGFQPQISEWLWRRKT